MFTGIVTGIGHIQKIEDLGQQQQAYGKRLTIQAPKGYLVDVALGDSIALNGACMTVTSLDIESDCFTIEVSAKSLQRTTGLVQLGDLNLEKALQANDRLGGHLVSGHVDDIGLISRFESVGESFLVHIVAPAQLAQFVAIKGSITVQGVSLTVNSVQDLPDQRIEFSINLIAHTMLHTTLKHLHVGAAVNLEIDVFARYIARMMQHGNPPSQN